MNELLKKAPKKKKAPDLDALPGGRKQTRTLPCKLTDEERHEKAQDLARHHIEIGVLEDEKKAVTDEYKHKIGVHEAKVGELSTQIHAGFQSRDIPCWWEMDTPEKGKKTLYRVDLLEGVEVVNMTGEDLQMDMADMAAKKKAAKKKRAAKKKAPAKKKALKVLKDPLALPENAEGKDSN